MRVSIIIPNYNGEELLKRNLPAVLKAAAFYKKGEVEIIFVDDFSSDNSIKIAKGYNSKLKIIKNEKNLGFSSSVNRGVRESLGEILIFLNTDVAPQENFLEPLLEHFDNESIFAVGCMDKSIEADRIILRGRGIGKWEKGFLIHNRGEVSKTNTLWVSGGSGAFRKSIWEKLGGFNELYNPFYWEDIDLSYRALKSGYQVLFEPKSIVIHEHEIGAIKKKYTKKYIKTIAYKNQFIFVWENATDLDLQFLHIFWLPYYFIKSLLSRNWPFFMGFLKAFILLPKIIRSSFKSQKLFTKSDREVVKEF